MPKKGENRCPACGDAGAEPYEAWEPVAPFPEKQNRVTVTTFGMLNDP